MRFNASTTLQKETENGGSLYILVLVGKNDISELVKESDAENTKRQRNTQFLIIYVFKKLCYKLFNKQFCFGII